MPQLAAADLAVTNPDGLGQMHAFLDFCIQVDPLNSTAFKGQWQSIVGGQNTLLAKIEQKPAYINEYAAFTRRLQKLPATETVNICKVTARLWKTGT